MTLQDLLQQYYQDPRVLEISKSLETGKPQRIFLRGLAGSSISFIATSVIKNHDASHLFILNDKEEAAYFFNDLENIIGEEKALFFPSSYRKPYQTEEIDNANVLMRTEVLNKINKIKHGFLGVSYPEALHEKVITRKTLSLNTLDIHQDEKLSVEFIIDVLIEYGFDRVDFVKDPGQFAIRGGIIDIFSFSNDYPYRIELFGNEVDSIRIFDPVTQLSVKRLVRISIVPNIQDKNLLKESRESFFEYISPETVIWIKDIQFLEDRLDKNFELAEKFHSEHNGLLKPPVPKELFINRESYSESSQKFNLIEFGGRKHFVADQEFNFEIAPQPSFNKNFELLTEDLSKKSSQKYLNFFFADSAKQIERIYSIFEDLNKARGESKYKNTFFSILSSIHEGFIDKDKKIACYTDHQVFERYHRFRLRDTYQKKKEAITLKELYSLQPGDYVAHIDHGIGKYGGLEKIEVHGKTQEAIRLMYKDNDILYVSIHSLHKIAKFSGSEGAVPKINKLGSGAWQALKLKTKSKVKDIARDLIALYAKRRAKKGFRFSPDNYLQNELEASFIYEDTPDQVKATLDFKKDMESGAPMDRLICGDVGFGKTEIAVRAAFKAVNDSKQVAILVPTTILALQHYKTFKSRLAEFPCNVDYINRFKSPKGQKETLRRLAAGEIDIIIGTHRIISKDVKFKDLGLLIIDEEQKFGVAAKDRLKAIKVNVDTLTLTATPIPRTLHFSMMGARDLSIISTPPPNRFPVQTELHVFNEEIIRDAISYEISRGGQVFFVHNRVQNINEIAGIISRLCPDAKILVGHGQMDGEKLEDVMMNFIEGNYDVLVATTIIESGLDIPNANTIIINEAHRFGLSDLHQMRGRVGRSNKKAFCYLLSPPVSVLSTEARKRLQAIEQFSDLGSGFNIAMRDLDIRGAGNLLGAEQSGFITEIGFDMYQKILDEAIQELKESEFKDLFDGKEDSFISSKPAPIEGKVYVKDLQIDTDLELLIPDNYVNSISERLSLYKELDETRTEEDLSQFQEMLMDRFGPVPKQLSELIETIRLRWLGIESGMEKITLRNNKMICYFISDPNSQFYQSDIFTRILQFVQYNPMVAKMKETPSKKLTLTFENVKSIGVAKGMLGRMLDKMELANLI